MYKEISYTFFYDTIKPEFKEKNFFEILKS